MHRYQYTFFSQDSYTRAILSSSLLPNDDSDSGGESRKPGQQQQQQQQYRHPQNAEEMAAVAIQSAFKGYRTRKDIQEIQSFYRQVSESDQPPPSLPPPVQQQQQQQPPQQQHANEPLSLKKRQNSYLQAVGVRSPEEEMPLTSSGQSGNVRSWKVRQDSYQRAMGGSAAATSPEGNGEQYAGVVNERVTKAKRQDSYLQAIDRAGADAPPPPTAQERRKGGWSARQDSYQRALEQADGGEEEMEVDGGGSPKRTLARVDTEESSEDGFAVAAARGLKRSDSYKRYREAAEEFSLVPAEPNRRRQQQQQQQQNEEMPDLNDEGVAKAAVKIQSVFRGFQTRRTMSSTVQTAQAAMKIQVGQLADAANSNCKTHRLFHFPIFSPHSGASREGGVSRTSRRRKNLAFRTWTLRRWPTPPSKSSQCSGDSKPARRVPPTRK